MFKDAFHDFPKQNNSAAKKMLQKLDLLVEAVYSLKQTPNQTNSASIKAGSTESKCKSSRGGPLHSLIRLHCATLFGKSYGSENLPPPATILEKSSWRQTEDFGTEEDSDGAMDEDSDILMNKTYDSVSNFKPDPSFPYGDGPGHRQALPQTLAIIWQTMQKAGVSKFRPDLCQGFTSPDNLFLWNLAFKSFIILVRCGEYRDISLDMFDEKEIWEALKNHVKNCLKRRFLEGMMDVDAQVAKAKAQRSQSQVTKHVY
ncbi:hypothetical protein BY996DRAFT_6417861 [Phakopsora pachyrhizi]|nr:hypothetical protein BY996DRAFT_6417861 [Phakopsora pachyrhizi]